MATAPPCVRSSSRCSWSAWRSRRTVAAQTPRSRVRSSTSTLPRSDSAWRMAPSRSARFIGRSVREPPVVSPRTTRPPPPRERGPRRASRGRGRRGRERQRPAAQASARHAASGRPSRRPRRNPASNASPAPTASTIAAPAERRRGRRRPAARRPRAPRRRPASTAHRRALGREVARRGRDVVVAAQRARLGGVGEDDVGGAQPVGGRERLGRVVVRVDRDRRAGGARGVEHAAAVRDQRRHEVRPSSGGRGARRARSPRRRRRCRGRRSRPRS